MAIKPLTSEQIAVAEKKLSMTLDDIIKMSKKTEKNVKQRQRTSNKSKSFVSVAAKDKVGKAKQYMNSRVFLRQGALAKRRSNFQGSQFPVTTMVAQKAVRRPFLPRTFNHSKASNWHKPRIGDIARQKSALNEDFALKHQHQNQQQQHRVMRNQNHQTLDSRFANMQGQRLRSSSHQNGAVQRYRGCQQGLPWLRGRFGN